MSENLNKNNGETNVSVKTYHDFHELLANPEIDAVIVSVPDHQHTYVAISAMLSRKSRKPEYDIDIIMKETGLS